MSGMELGSSSDAGSSLILIVYDRTGNVSATFDLGLNYASFSQNNTSFTSVAPGTAQTWNLAAGDYKAAWDAFVAESTTWRCSLGCCCS